MNSPLLQQAVEALSDLADVAERCDSWQSFPSAPLEKARATLAVLRAAIQQQPEAVAQIRGGDLYWLVAGDERLPEGALLYTAPSPSTAVQQEAHRKLVELGWPDGATSPQPVYYVAHPDGTFTVADPQPLRRAAVQQEAGSLDRATVLRLAREAVSNGDGSELSGDAIERFAQLVFLEAATAPTQQPPSDQPQQENGNA